MKRQKCLFFGMLVFTAILVPRNVSAQSFNSFKTLNASLEDCLNVSQLPSSKQSNPYSGCTPMGAVHKRDPLFAQKVDALWADCEYGNSGIFRLQEFPDRIHAFCCPRHW